MAITSIQSNAFKKKVAKLSYQVRGLFRIIQCTERGYHLVRKLNTPNNLELKFMVTDLYPLPSSLKSCEHIDSSDIR